MPRLGAGRLGTRSQQRKRKTRFPWRVEPIVEALNFLLEGLNLPLLIQHHLNQLPLGQPVKIGNDRQSGLQLFGELSKRYDIGGKITRGFSEN
jgi:hypothetical protein